jgi:hypothetical protein
MKRVNQHIFYQLGLTVHPLSNVEEGLSLQQSVWELNNARTWLAYILKNDLFNLVVSRNAAQAVIDAINTVVPEKTSDFNSIDAERKLTWVEAYRISHGVSDFETVIAAELATFDTYIVSKKGIYATADLIERAEMAIDDIARSSIPDDAQNDFKQAGKCLAFELPTAAGFHTMRSVEAVIRKYWTLVKKPESGTRPPEMAQCINELRSEGEDAKLMDILDHIRDLHRNTIMHPEAFLKITDALRLFDIAKSAISAMGDRIKQLEPGPSALSAIFAAVSEGLR